MRHSRSKLHLEMIWKSSCYIFKTVNCFIIQCQNYEGTERVRLTSRLVYYIKYDSQKEWLFINAHKWETHPNTLKETALIHMLFIWLSLAEGQPQSPFIFVMKKRCNESEGWLKVSAPQKKQSHMFITTRAWGNDRTFIFFSVQSF